MSLAEKRDNTNVIAPAGTASGGFDNILRLALNGGRPRAPARDSLSAAPDFQAAVDMLDRASSAMRTLQIRCDQLEQQLKSERQHFHGEIRAAVDQAREWERRAVSVKAQLSDAETLVSDADMRVEAASRRAEAAEARLLVAERRAEEATERARLYHDKIVAIFAPKG